MAGKRRGRTAPARDDRHWAAGGRLPFPIPHGSKGGGKSGGGGKTPKENKDTIRSRQIARIVDLYSEGETGGLYDGAKSIILEETPLENADGTRNFSGIEYEERYGLPDQAHVAGFPGPEAEIQVGVQVTFNSSVTRQITDTDLDAVVVKIGIPRLVSLTEGGNLVGAHAYYAIDLQPDGGSFTQVLANQVIAKASSPYEIEHRIELTGSAPWNVRVRRTNADSDSSRVENQTWWNSYTKVIDNKLTYPNDAYIALTANAEEFGDRIPSRAYDVKGIKIQVPTNYDPVARTYATTGPGTTGGLWDLTFKRAISDNPVWIVYDILTENRYGLGDYLGGLLPDKSSFYAASQFCDELVPDGAGGTEPRFTCNVWLASRENGIELIRALLATCWASLVAGGDSIVLVQDRPTDATELLAPANAIGGAMPYEGSDLDERHSVAWVSWNNPDNKWRPEPAAYEDPELIALYSWKKTDVTLLGCTRESQALRHARYIIETEKAGPDLVTFQGSFELSRAGPGDVIKVADPAIAGFRGGGRLAAATTTQLTLDQAVTLEIGTTYSIEVVLPDKSLETREIVNAPGSHTVIDLASALSAAPMAGDGKGAMWAITSPLAEPRQFRLLTVTEDEPNIYGFVGLQHDPDKFDRIFNNLQLPDRSYSTIPTGQILAPSAITAEEMLFESGASVLNKVVIGWTPPADPRVISFEVEAAEPDSDQYGRWEVTREVVSTRDDVPLGLWRFRVRALDGLGTPSQWVTTTLNVQGKTAAPADVSGFLVTAQGTTATAKWTLHPDLDVEVGGAIVIRYTPETGGDATWDNALEVARFAGTQNTGQVPLLAGSYLAKAQDSSGNYSTNAVKTETASTGFLNFNAVTTQIEDPLFTGTKVNLMVVDTEIAGDAVSNDSIPDYDAVPDIDAYSLTAANVLTLAGSGLNDDIADYDAVADVDSYGGVATAGSYLFSDIVDFGALYESVRITAEIRTRSFAIGSTIATREGNVSEWESITGAVPGGTSAILYISTTDDDPAGTPDWGEYVPFVPGDYRGNAARFRLDLAATIADQNIQVSRLRVTVDMPDRLEAFFNLQTSASAAVRVEYSVPFRATPATTVTPIDMEEDETIVLSNEDETGFDLDIVNGVGARQVRTFNAISKGDGARIV